MSSRIKIPRSYVTVAPECDKIATSLISEHLIVAVECGNRATKRKAIRNMLKKARAWAKTPSGKAALAIQKREAK